MPGDESTIPNKPPTCSTPYPGENGTGQTPSPEPGVSRIKQFCIAVEVRLNAAPRIAMSALADALTLGHGTTVATAVRRAIAGCVALAIAFDKCFFYHPRGKLISDPNSIGEVLNQKFPSELSNIIISYLDSPTMISDAIEIPTKSPWDRNDKFPDPSYDNEAILKSLRTILKNSPMPKEKKDFAASVVKALFQVTAYKIRELDWEPNESYWVNIDSEEGGRKNIAFYPAQWDRLIQSWANRYYT